MKHSCKKCDVQTCNVHGRHKCTTLGFPSNSVPGSYFVKITIFGEIQHWYYDVSIKASIKNACIYSIMLKLFTTKLFYNSVK